MGTKPATILPFSSDSAANPSPRFQQDFEIYSRHVYLSLLYPPMLLERCGRLLLDEEDIRSTPASKSEKSVIIHKNKEAVGLPAKSILYMSILFCQLPRSVSHYIAAQVTTAPV